MTTRFHIPVAVICALLTNTGCSVASRAAWGGFASGFGIQKKNRPRRTGSDDKQWHANPPVVVASAADLADSKQRKLVNAAFHEVHPEFDLHIVEFDDQGWLWNRAAWVQTLTCLRQELGLPVPLTCPVPAGAPAREQTDGAVLITFVHGWKHNAEVCDDNLTCFRSVLELVATREHKWAASVGGGRLPRRVIGVYVGWRGKTAMINPWKQITAESRKTVAERIGHSSDSAEVFTGMEAAWRLKYDQEARESKETRSLMLTVGHSYGADFLYSTIAPVLTSRASETAQANAALPEPLIPVRGFGTLAVLVNPAFEAQVYESFNQRALAAEVKYPDDQPPVLLTVTSESDWATGKFFPVNQALTFTYKGARRRGQWRPFFTTVGHYEPYLTHDLSPGSNAAAAASAANKRAPVCGCRFDIQSIAERLGKSEEQNALAAAEQQRTGRIRQDNRQSRTAAAVLRPRRDLPRNLPFINARASAAVVNGHSDIYNPVFVEFLFEYLGQQQAEQRVRTNVRHSLY
jgi:hypothetical protein